MSIPKPTMNRSTAILFALVLTLALPLMAFAQGRGNGQGRGNLDKKCAKFVNCHDARDGRWDGRGPAINQTGQIPNVPIFRNPRVPQSNPDDEILYPRTRHRRTDRDRDSDCNGNDRIRRRRTADVDRNGDGNVDGSDRRRPRPDGSDGRQRRARRQA